MRISDWSSDVCSSDLAPDADGPLEEPQAPESNQPKGLTFGPGCRYHRGNAPTALRSDRTTDDPCPIARQALQGAGEHGGYPDRSEESSVGQACVSTCVARWSPWHSKKNTQT